MPTVVPNWHQLTLDDVGSLTKRCAVEDCTTTDDIDPHDGVPPSEGPVVATSWRWPAVMLVLRVAVIAVGMAVAYVIFALGGHSDALLLALSTATLMTIIANVVSLALLVKLTGAAGRRLRDLVGFSWRRLLPDIGWGLLYLLVLNTPFVLVIVTLTVVVYTPSSGPEIGAAFQHVFAGPLGEGTPLSIEFPVWYTVAVAVCFPLLNPMVEEMHYRAWLQPALIAVTGRGWVGIALMAVGFGLQHVPYGWTLEGAGIYFAAFFVWGSVAGLIYRRQKRLVPLIVTHFFVNAPFVAVPVLFAVFV